MVKHPACAAAINSSGLVPFSSSKRVRNEYGVSASTPESVERVPLPARPVPCQTAFALRIMEASLGRAAGAEKLDVLAAVDVDLGAVDVGRRLRAQHVDDLRHFVGCAETVHRDVLHDF